MIFNTWINENQAREESFTETAMILKLIFLAVFIHNT